MKLRNIVVGLMAITVAVGCSTTSRPKVNEPTYQNRRLSEWLLDFDNYSLSPAQRAMAADAVRHLGTPAVPFLVENLSETRWKQFQRDEEKWRARQMMASFQVPRPSCPRNESLAALDALGAEAAPALPALEKLLREDFPDHRALYVAARIGPAGRPLINSFLTSTNKVLRLESQICLEMMDSRSELLYPRIPVGPDAPTFERRICELNLKILEAAVKVYQAEHPKSFSPGQNPYAQPPPARPQ